MKSLAGSSLLLPGTDHHTSILLGPRLVPSSGRIGPSKMVESAARLVTPPAALCVRDLHPRLPQPSQIISLPADA